MNYEILKKVSVFVLAIGIIGAVIVLFTTIYIEVPVTTSGTTTRKVFNFMSIFNAAFVFFSSYILYLMLAALGNLGEDIKEARQQMAELDKRMKTEKTSVISSSQAEQPKQNELDPSIENLVKWGIEPPKES